MYATSVFWFRRDLRLYDNHGLYSALSQSRNVIPVFVFDTAILSDLTDNKDARVTFIHQAIGEIKRKLENLGGTIHVLYGDPVKVIPEFVIKHQASALFANEDYEPYATQRDEDVRKVVEPKGVSFALYKDQVVLGPTEVLKNDGKPYSVFTPYMKKWKEVLSDRAFASYASDGDLLESRLLQGKPFDMPSITQIGFKKSDLPIPGKEISDDFLKSYSELRNYPKYATSRLGVHLRFGTLSIRQLMKHAQTQSEVFMNELIWREFYMMILAHFPQVVTQAFKPKYDRITWRNDTEEFDRWCRGETGFPLVDAGMRQLNAIGFMHNRVRMMAASFLVKDLLIDWRWGEAYFAEKLLDYELASNNGGWQWAAGSGCDAAPYFRIFNPDTQWKKFDPQSEYVAQWVPEYNSTDYVKPVVDHKEARKRALAAYKSALQ